MLHGFWEDVKELAQVMESRSRVALTNGCYDVIHAGHIVFLSWLQQQLHQYRSHVPLVVAINSDASVARLKGPGRPVNTAYDRATVLLSLRMVDHVVVFEEKTPLETVKVLNPIVLAKGGDYADKEIVGETFVLSNGGQVLKGPYLNGFSSTEIIKRCKVTFPVGLNSQTAPR